MTTKKKLAAQVKFLLRENNQLTKAAKRFRDGYLAEYEEASRLASELAEAKNLLARVLHCGSGCQACQRDTLRILSKPRRKCGAK